MWEIIRVIMFCFFGIIVVTMILDVLEAVFKAICSEIGWVGMFLLLFVLTIALLGHSMEEDMIRKNNVVQFNENHKWCGCLGIVTEVKDCGEHGYRYQIGVPVPNNGDEVYTAFIFDDGSGIEKVGKAVLTLPEKED